MNIYINKNKQGGFFMEYTKDVFLKFKYNSDLNKLQIEKERWTSRLTKTIKNH